MKYRAKPPEVEALTFDELVEFGKTQPTAIVEGMPVSFSWNGFLFTRRDSDCYLLQVPLCGSLWEFSQGEIISVDCDVPDCPYIWSADHFARAHEPA